MDDIYSFFFLTSRQKTAAFAVYSRLRHFYKTAPLYILTDADGENLAEFCINDSFCKTVMSEVKFGHDWQDRNFTSLQPSTIEKMTAYLHYMKQAALWGNRTFLVYIEEDIWFQQKFGLEDLPKGDVGGIWNPWYKAFHPRLQNYIARQPNAVRMSNPRVIFGGSYYRTAALIDCIDRVLPHANWYRIHVLDDRILRCWDTVPPVLFALGGYSIVPWSAVCEKEHRYLEYTNRTCDRAPLRHKGNPAKELYNIPWNETSKNQVLLSYG